MRSIIHVSLVAMFAAALAVLPAAAQPGGADFSRFVSVGDSLTAGFISGGLIADVQENSYPSLIFQQATGAPASAFEQPLVSPPGIPALLQLRSLSPLVIASASGMGLPLNLTLARPYSNLAVPGAEVADALRTVTDNGGLHDLILRGLGTQVQQALVQQPTFVTVWLGNNDALAAATSGVVIEGVTLTPAAEFEADYRAVVGALAQSGAGLALANIPEVTAIPFVTALPPVLINPATNQPVLVGGAPVPLLGPDGPLRPGQDFLLLTATQELAVGNGIPLALGGSGLPLSSQVVLSADEAAAINARVADYNRVIRSVANEVGAALVDMNAIFAEIARSGVLVGGIDFGTDFLTGGLFSFDGVHATPLGYAVVANAFIDAINAKFGNSIAQVGLSPFVFGPLASRGTGIADASVAGMKLTRAAEDQLRFALGVPKRRALRAIMRQQGMVDVAPRGDNSGGGDRPGDDPPQRCPLPPGHPKFCDVCGPCAVGEGDCDLKPNQCRAGLVCVQDIGADYGFHHKIDVCQTP